MKEFYEIRNVEEDKTIKNATVEYKYINFGAPLKVHDLFPDYKNYCYEIKKLVIRKSN